MTPSSHPFVLDHLAFGVPDISAVAGFLVGTLGGRPFEAGPGVEFLWWQWRFPRGATLEVLEPDDTPDGFLRRFLVARGPGVHHVTFKVPDLAAAAERVRSLGYETVGYFDGLPAWKECFLHPKQAHGIVVQLAESNPELEPDERSDLPFPPSPPPADPMVDVLGVRLSAHSEAEALHQWQQTLGGTRESTHEGLRFRWPDSPLRIDVRIDPAAPEGPIAVDVATSGAAGLPDDGRSSLGISFLDVAK